MYSNNVLLHYAFVASALMMLTYGESARTSDQTIDPWTGPCQKPQPKIRILAAIPRSGSTLMMQVFGEVPECAVTSRLVLMSNYGDFCPDYTIFRDPPSQSVYRKAVSEHKSILISKEELGHDYSKGECDYNIFPDTASIKHTKAAFLFRDPIRVFDSWKAVGWTNIQSLLTAYRKLFNTWQSNHHTTIALAYKELVHHPETTIPRLCRHWDINYSHQLLSFTRPFANEFSFCSERERRIYTTRNPLGLFDTIQSNSSINPNIKSHNLLTIPEQDIIERNLGGLYMATYGDRIQPLKDGLASKTHWGFDLDDTLHEFRKASGAAATAVFEYLVANTHDLTTEIPPTVEGLKTTYSQILSRTTSTAFSDGKTSDDYRKERFLALMQAHNLLLPSSNHKEMIQALLSLYKHTLQTSLTLKPGVLPLLSHLKTQLQKKIIIITEGPEDAQLWTLQQLDIADYVDHLFTSNKIGKSKMDGLFAEVLKQLGITAEEMVFVGDNLKRDVEAARKEGIMAVLLDEGGSVRLEMEGEGVSVNSLWKLGELVGMGGDDEIEG
ncbi:MAG: hypothetical protein Q9169_001017 [Polycauliona sp. 2 TL-2023]